MLPASLLLQQTPHPIVAGPVGTSSAAAPLFYIPGATDGSLQWKAETFQLVNWGGFEGRVRFDFHPGATLISGASGTGKSTLLDAYIALMMPSDTSFNGASNDAVAGRARSAEQRNLLSYLRGQTDTTADDSGRERPKVLRGDGRPTWGAVAMTFVDDHARRFTALRVYHVPARATQAGDIIMRMATYEGRLDLADLAVHAGALFAPKPLKAAFPGLLTHDSYAAFAARLYARLGIGANGDGTKALRLLVRIQAGHQIRTVDELYKEMVLERPASFEAADRAIGHFDDLEVAYNAMRTEQQKAELLGAITQKHADLVAAMATIERIDTFGLNATDDSPILLWRLRREAALLEAVITDNRAKHEHAVKDHTGADKDVRSLDEELGATRAAHQAAGGAELDSLAQQVTQAGRSRDERLARRNGLAERTVCLATPLHDNDVFDQLHATAGTFLAHYEAASKALRDSREGLRDRSFPLLQRRKALSDEQASLSGRAGRVPKFLDDLRRQAAEASGIDVADLPFVAELIDVAPEHARWRTAVETVLGASARLLLVPQEQLEAFSTAIDPLRLRGRLTFEGARLHQTGHLDEDSTKVAGKLLFKDSPFAGWVRRHVSDPVRNALCVERPHQLDGPGYRVTLAGQTRLGVRGSHGRNDQSNIIGFSNEDAIADIERELDQITEALDKIDEDRKAIDEERDELDRRRSAYEAIRAITWEDIDVASVEARIAELQTARQAILDADDRLQALQRRIDELEMNVDKARERRFDLKRQKDDLDTAWASLTRRQDNVNGELSRLRQEQRIALSDEQATALDEHFIAAVGPANPNDLDQFPANLARLHQRLSAAVKQAQAQAQNSETELERIFTAYQLKFNDPNLGRSAASYPDYAAILDTILTTGLHERREEWRQRLMKWSGEDLVPLAGAMDLRSA
ncbi:hypothetical protein DLJ47_30420 [Micromonospora sp. S4605]|nr:hypothetical protein DLJ47_30420 [Micromonospora sp. S4605]